MELIKELQASDSTATLLSLQHIIALSLEFRMSKRLRRTARALRRV